MIKMARKKAFHSTPFGSALLDSLRIIVLAIIPVVIISLQGWTIDWRQIVIVGGVAFLKFIDKFLHKSDIAEKGLTRF